MLLEEMPRRMVTAALTPIKDRGAAKRMMARRRAMLALLEKMP